MWAVRSLQTPTSALDASNVTKRVWKIGDVVDVLEAWEPFGARKQDNGGLHLRHGLFGLPTARGVIQ